MNKQKLIEYCEYLKGDLNKFINGIDVNKIIKMIEQLDEPQKVMIPQFVADYIRYAIENDWDFQDLFKCIEDEEDEKLLRWLYHERNQETLATAWINGYEVEKEKRYIVKVKGISVVNGCLKCDVDNSKWFFSEPEESDRYRAKHTIKELDKAGFGWVFDCTGIEIEEAAE